MFIYLFLLHSNFYFFILFQTVSTGPRSRPPALATAVAMDRQCATEPHRRPIQNSSPFQCPPPAKRRSFIEQNKIVLNDNEPERKKEKKWSLGGLFRRRKRSESESSSDEETGQRKGGFLAMRRSRRDKRKKSVKPIGTFDHVVVNPSVHISTKPKPIEEPPPSPNRIGLPTPPRSSRESLIAEQRRTDSSLTRNSSGSGSLEGLGRREKRVLVKARAEAIRERTRGGSSSDDGEPVIIVRSDENLHRQNSFSRKTRAARTERYIKRLSRDDEGFIKKESDQNIRSVKSDAEGNFSKRISRSDHRRTPSATPSPSQSPRVRRHYISSVPLALSYDSQVYPPHNATNSLDRKSHRNTVAKQSPVVIRKIDSFNSPRSPTNYIHQEDENVHLTNQRSYSYDNNINAINHYNNTTNRSDSKTQMPIVHVPPKCDLSLTIKNVQIPPPPPPRDPQRRLIPSQPNESRPISYAFDPSNQKKLTLPWVPHLKSSSEDHIPIQSNTKQILKPRPTSVTTEVINNRYLSNDFTMLSKVKQNSPQYQYFADQNPRSRKPIHIQCSPPSTPNDQLYLSDSQVVMKPPYWRQEHQTGIRQKLVTAAAQAITSSPPPAKPPRQFQRSRSNSPSICPVPPHHESVRAKPIKVHVTTSNLASSVRTTDSLSSLSGSSDIGGNEDLLKKKKDTNSRPLSMVLEKGEVHEIKLQDNSKAKSPPIPPVRRYSRQNSLEISEWMPDDLLQHDEEKNRRSSNLEDALTELEAIYKSLRLGDEDLLDRAERRDLPTPHQELYEARPLISGPPTWARGAESDSGFNYGYQRGSSIESLFESEIPKRRQRTPGYRRSGIPDKVTDDMAYRRLNHKDKPASDQRNVVSKGGSYLLTSPATKASNEIQKSPSPRNVEPDITFDDVVYRNIKHANNSLKISEPQLPFGIPIGPVTAAANSDYLHASPGDLYRPTFKPRKTPDVVKDDLAFRNLRKDDSKDSTLPPVNNIDDHSTFRPPTNLSKSDANFSLRKRRAVRSLSANLPSLIAKESFVLPVNSDEIDFEKAQSLSDLPDALHVAQRILEGKEVIGVGKPWAAESNNSSKQKFNANNTSTETLTDSRANLSWHQKLRVFVPPEETKSQQNTLNSNNESHTPSESKEIVSVSSNENQELEDLLSALAKEARATSEKLSKKLEELSDDFDNKPEKIKESLVNSDIKESENFSNKNSTVLSCLNSSLQIAHNSDQLNPEIEKKQIEDSMKEINLQNNLIEPESMSNVDISGDDEGNITYCSEAKLFVNESPLLFIDDSRPDSLLSEEPSKDSLKIENISPTPVLHYESKLSNEWSLEDTNEDLDAEIQEFQKISGDLEYRSTPEQRTQLKDDPNLPSTSEATGTALSGESAGDLKSATYGCLERFRAALDPATVVLVCTYHAWSHQAAVYDLLTLLGIACAVLAIIFISLSV